MKLSDVLVRSGAVLALVFWLTLGAAACWAQGVLGLSPENSTPIYSALGMAPKVLLTLSRDHTLAYVAYNDFNDIDGDGISNVNDADEDGDGVKDQRTSTTATTLLP